MKFLGLSAGALPELGLAEGRAEQKGKAPCSLQELAARREGAHDPFWAQTHLLGQERKQI